MARVRSSNRLEGREKRRSMSEGGWTGVGGSMGEADEVRVGLEG